MDLNVRTEATIYLDSEDDEDPLRLSPRSSPSLPSSNALRNQVRNRFAQIQKNGTTQALIIPIAKKPSAHTPSLKVALSKDSKPIPQNSQIIEVIDLEDDSPNTSPLHVALVRPSTSTASIHNVEKNGTAGGKHNIRNGHNVSSPAVSTSANASGQKNISAVAATPKVSVVSCKSAVSELPSRKRHGLHATNQVVAIASTSKECSQFVLSVPTSPKKSKPNREEDCHKVGSHLKAGGLTSGRIEFIREGGLHATNKVAAIPSTSKDCAEVIIVSQSSPKTIRPSGEDTSSVAATSSFANGRGINDRVAAIPSPIKTPRNEASAPVLASPFKANMTRREETVRVVASPTRASSIRRVETVRVVESPSRGKEPGHDQKVPESFSSSKKNRPDKEEIDLTMSKLVESNATNLKVFQKFLEICLACDSSPEVKVLLKKKTSRYYDHLQAEYEESAMFRSLLEENISIMAKNPASVFTCLVNVHSEMKRQRVVANSGTKSSAKICNTPGSARKSPTLHAHQENGEHVSSSLETEEDKKEARKREKTQQHIKNLERALRHCNLRIKKLEEAEVDWDEEDDSSYMKMQRYRRKCIDIHRKLVELKGIRDDAIKTRARVASSCPYPDVRTAIERYVFTKSAFPDYSDVVKIYQEANIPGLSLQELKFEAEKTFKEIGSQIQRDRQVYDWNLACAFLDHTSDPAEDDPGLRLQLQHNKKLGDSKLDEVMASFTRKQYEQRLEPVEVPDEVAAVSDDAEDDDDDAEEEEEDKSEDDMRDDLIDFGGNATDNDSDTNEGPSSNGSLARSQGEKTEKDHKNDGKNPAKESSETKSSESSSGSKQKSSGTSLSYTEYARKKISTKMPPVKDQSLKSPKAVLTKPLRYILPALPPGQALPSPQTLTHAENIPPSQILMSHQNLLSSENLMAPQNFIPSEDLLQSQNFIPHENLMQSQNYVSPQTLVSTQTLLPIQIIVPAQTQLLSLSHVPQQTQQTYTTESTVNPIRKYQLEALSSYLEMKYQIDPSAITTKSVSSLAEATSLEESESPSSVVADSTESKPIHRFEKMGSDPEVTSTSIDGELLLDSEATFKKTQIAGDSVTATKQLDYIETSQVFGDSETARKVLDSQANIKKTQVVGGNITATKLIDSEATFKKTQIAGDSVTATKQLDYIKTSQVFGDSETARKVLDSQANIKKTHIVGDNVTATKLIDSEVNIKKTPVVFDNVAARKVLDSQANIRKVQTSTKIPNAGDSFVERQLATDSVSARSHAASTHSSTKGQIKSNDFPTKSHLAIKEQATETRIKGKCHKSSFSEVHSSYVLNRKCEDIDCVIEEDKFLSNSMSDDVIKESSEIPNDNIFGRESAGDVDLKETGKMLSDANVSTGGKFWEDSNCDSQQEGHLEEELVVKEDGLVNNEVTEAESSMSSNESTVDLEDWENMIMPTIVAKDTHILVADISRDVQEIETGTYSEVNLDPTDEYVQKSPTIKTFQWKGRDIIASSKVPMVKIPYKPTSMSEEVIAPPPAMVMISRESSEIPQVTEKTVSEMDSSTPSSSTSTVSSCGGGEIVQEVKRICAFFPPRKLTAEKLSSHYGKTYTSRRPRTRSAVGNSNNGRDGMTVPDAGSSQLSGLPEVRESKEIASATGLVKTLIPTGSPGVFTYATPTARKTISRRTIVIKLKKPVVQSEPVLKVGPVSRNSPQSLLPKAVSTESESNASEESVPVLVQPTKPTARKSFPKVNPGCKSWAMVKLKEEQISSWDGKDSVQSMKVTDSDVIVIDSD